MPQHAMPSPPHARSEDPSRPADALALAAAQVAAPRRRLLAGLRDAHAETCLRIEALRRAATMPGQPARPLVQRLLAEAEEQLHRVEIVLAHLHTRPGGGLVDRAAGALAVAAEPPLGREAALVAALEMEERRGLQDVAALRDLAHLAGQHLAARLLDLTVEERAAAARDLAALARASPPGLGEPLHH